CPAAGAADDASFFAAPAAAPASFAVPAAADEALCSSSPVASPGQGASLKTVLPSAPTHLWMARLAGGTLAARGRSATANTARNTGARPGSRQVTFGSPVRNRRTIARMAGVERAVRQNRRATGAGSTGKVSGEKAESALERELRARGVVVRRIDFA